MNISANYDEILEKAEVFDKFRCFSAIFYEKSRIFHKFSNEVAYEQAELEFISKFGGRAYKNFQSFTSTKNQQAGKK